MSIQPSFDLTITAIGARGDGLAEVDGRRVFVPFTVPGDRVRVRLCSDKVSNEAERAEIIDVLEPGPTRATAVCPHFGTCGGCTIQHLADDAYVAWKRGLIQAALARVGLEQVPLMPLARTPPATRRRARFAVLKRGRRIWLGFNERLSHRLVDVTACPVLLPQLVAVLEPLRTVLAAVLSDGGRADAVVTRLDDGIDLLLIGPSRLDRTARERLARFAEMAGIARLSWQADDHGHPEPLAHRLPVSIRFGSATVIPPPGAFLQASAAGESALRAVVEDAVGGAIRIADLFAGVGTFSIPLAKGKASVNAVEGNPAAIEALARSVGGLRLTTAKRDLFKDPLTVKELDRFDAVVFDPPRAGAAAQVAMLAASKVPMVVGVSCNPVTFARDARTLVDGGYTLTRIVPVDQFLWSAHIELAGVFVRAV